MRCIVDCREDNRLENNYLILSLWGKPCFTYVIEAVEKADCFSEIEILTNSPMIIDYCKEHYPKLNISPEIQESSQETNEAVFRISGRAPCISPATIRDAVDVFNGMRVISSRSISIYDFEDDAVSFYGGSEQQKINAFTIFADEVSMNDRNYAFYPVSNNEAVVINNVNDFELALVLKKKQENRSIVLQTIERIIREKASVFSAVIEEKSICMVGHSQLDQWDISEILGYKVRNCGVSGISSFEYDEKILSQNKLNCESDVFVVMHGTNDVVWDYTIDEIVSSIKKIVDYIRERKPSAPIFFLSCLHVNGRLDRNNTRIDEMNIALKDELKDAVVWIDTTFMDDKYGNLDQAYTNDGLHISEAGYEVLRTEIEKAIKGG